MCLSESHHKEKIPHNNLEVTALNHQIDLVIADLIIEFD
jgi:hypothetical protein